MTARDAFESFRDDFLDPDDVAELNTARTGKRVISDKERAQKRAAGIASALKRTEAQQQALSRAGAEARRQNIAKRRALGLVGTGHASRPEPSARALEPWLAKVDRRWPEEEFTPARRRAKAILLLREDAARNAREA